MNSFILAALLAAVASAAAFDDAFEYVPQSASDKDAEDKEFAAMMEEGGFVDGADVEDQGPYIRPHIIQGRDAKVGEFPWQGSLQRLGRKMAVETYPGHTCGCVLVSDQWVVTAAHCVGAGANGLYVVLGLHKRGDNTIGTPVGYYIENIISHPDWIGFPGSTDAAMIKLNQKVEMNDNVKTIAMADDGDNFDRKTCTISGWGVTTEGGGSPSEVLQAADVPVMPLAECQDLVPIADEGHICVGGIGEAGSCNGDSGGPLVCEGKLAGVTSFGIVGCFTTFPSVYTRIGFVRSWIRQVSEV